MFGTLAALGDTLAGVSFTAPKAAIKIRDSIERSSERVGIAGRKYILEGNCFGDLKQSNLSKFGQTRKTPLVKSCIIVILDLGQAA